MVLCAGACTVTRQRNCRGSGGGPVAATCTLVHTDCRQMVSRRSMLSSFITPSSACGALTAGQLTLRKSELRQNSNRRLGRRVLNGRSVDQLHARVKGSSMRKAISIQ